MIALFFQTSIIYNKDIQNQGGLHMNNLIKKWRKEANMTQEELANLLFLTPQAVSLLENGKRTLQQETLQEVAKIFQKEIIFYVQDEPTFKNVTNQTIEQEIEGKIKKPSIIPIPKEDLEKVLYF